jgi:hypothetical protein
LFIALCLTNLGLRLAAIRAMAGLALFLLACLPVPGHAEQREQLEPLRLDATLGFRARSLDDARRPFTTPPVC